MNIQQYTHLLEHPEEIDATNTTQLREVIDAFPFFQSANALYIKGLNSQGSFSYNKALKKTAAHTTDRAVLFDYITSKEFIQNDISALIKEQKQRLQSIVINKAEDLSLQVEKEEQEKASQILDPNLFIEKENSILTSPTPEEVLKMGAPLPFTKSETHSFGEWLKLPSFPKIDRSATENITSKAFVPNNNTKSSQENTEEASNDTSTSINPENYVNTTELAEALSKKRKQKIIDSFIKNNPKIDIKLPVKGEKNIPQETNTFSSEILMTETLARVYVEQKNFKKAKQAFRILSLKYPEKSGFFADQIRAVKELEEQKE